MARNYAALSHEYLEEMAELDDAEFGRLARALLKYSMTGEVVELPGNERFYYRRVQMQEDRFQASYESTAARNRENGIKGGRPKNPKEPSETQKTETNTETNTKTEANTNSETKTNTKALPPEEGEGCAAVVSAYLDRINPSASQTSLEELKAYAQTMGSEVCLRAMDVALDSKKATWPYIRGILRKWQSQGVTCLADIKRLDRKLSQGCADPSARMLRDMAALNGAGGDGL